MGVNSRVPKIAVVILLEKDTVKNTNRELVIKAAEEIFANKGLYGARVDEIALLSGVNKRLVYKEFKSKEELYKVVLHEAYKRMARAESGIFKEYTTCVEAITNIIKMYFEYLKNNPSYIKLILWENLNEGKYIKEMDLSDVKTRVMDYMYKVLKDGKENGEFKEDTDENQVVFSIMTFTFSYFSNKHTMSNFLKEDIDFSKRVDDVTKMILLHIKK